MSSGVRPAQGGGGSCLGFHQCPVQAIGIVLIVCFSSLGFRAGLVVAFSIPILLTIVFLAMPYLGISLQRVSLGALIIALGLLVEMMP